MKVLIVGGGKLVYFLTRALISKGYSVTIINRDAEECKWMSRRLKATVVYGDGSDPQILEEAGSHSTDVMLAVTPNDQDNLVICQLANLRFHIPRTLAVVNDPENEEVFRKLDITAISTVGILSSLIEQKAGFDQIINLIPLSEGKINVTEVELTKDSPVAGKALVDIAMPENSLIASILRGGRPIVPRGATLLLPGDRLIAITLPENYGRVLRMLTGDVS